MNGRNICKYNQNNQYEGDLYGIVEWFCNNLEFILGYDEFPLPVEGSTALELINNADQYENDNMLEFDLWYAAKNRWILKHCWFIARGGSVLPCVYFRRRKDYIEIAWDNSFWKSRNVIFEFQSDVYIVEYESFLKILHDFLLSSVVDLEREFNNKENIRFLKTQIRMLEQ